MRRLSARIRRAGHVHVGLTMVFAVVLGYMGCTEEKAITAGDGDLPVVTMVFPVPPQGNPIDVSDSTTLVATVRDASGIDFVEFFRRGETDTTAVLIRRVESPDSTNDGVGYYSVNWRTGAISNGTTVQVFARATDTSGNVGRSENIDVRILNETELGPPNSCFIPVPAAGTIADNFTFDAGCTTDDIDPASELKVRWDFDNDGAWDIDTTDNRTPLDIVSWNFTAPGLYTVRMEAFNTYFEGGRIATGEVDVSNVGGEPRPQSDMIEIPEGTYTIGAVDTAGADGDERPVHTIRVSTYKIETNEVTNALYRTYLNKAREALAIEFFPPDAVLDTLGHKIIDFDQSQVFFAVDEDSFTVKPGFEEHPVAGVNWYGATSYAIFFGLRLPTEREWEIAAKGEFIDWKFPWGTELDSTRANYNGSGDPFDNDTTPVGYFDGSLRDTFQTNSGASPFGVNDMAGNVKEWVRDWYEPVYPVSPLPNYSGPATGEYKITRGGSYLSTSLGIRTTSREATVPMTMSPRIGFRTAFTVFDTALAVGYGP